MNVPHPIVVRVVLTVCIITWVTALSAYGYSVTEFHQLEQEFGADLDYSGEIYLDVYNQCHVLVFLLPTASMLLGLRLANRNQNTLIPLICYACASLFASFVWVVFAIQVIHLGSMREYYWL